MSTILICSVCSSVFGLSISYINNDIYKNYLGEVNDFGGYACVSNSYMNSFISDKSLINATQLFGNNMIPIYGTDKANVAVITPEIAEIFSFNVGKIAPDRDSWLPQNSSEVVIFCKEFSQESYYPISDSRICGGREFQNIAEVTMDIEQTRKKLTEYSERILEKGTNRDNYKSDNEYKESIDNKFNEIIYSLYHSINYFVHSDFLTEFLPYRPGRNIISFDYEEKVEIYDDMRIVKNTARGGFNNFGTLKQYATKIYYQQDIILLNHLKKKK